MAPNGTASRRTPVAPPKSTKSEDSGLLLRDLFHDLNNAGSPRLKDDVKENLPVVKKPGSWDSEVVHNNHKAKNPSSVLKKVPGHLANAFPNSNPMTDHPSVLKCNHCKRPVLEHAMPRHIERCLNKKQEKQRKKKEAKDARDAAARKEKGQDSDEEELEASKTATKTGASKKRKAIDEGDDGPASKKKKKKDEVKAKASKPKAPVDVEKQCGVELPQGGQCARSLTCKSHSMGAKRAVPGRSAPYDKLLMEYQRKNQAKMQKAAMDANAPNPDDENLSTGPVDEEEEKDSVMAAIARNWGGVPLFEQHHAPLQRKYQYNRIKGMLASALGGRSGGLFGMSSGGTGGFFGGGGVGGSSTGPPPREPAADADGIVHARRPSVVPGARSMMAPVAASRKASVASAA